MPVTRIPVDVIMERVPLVNRWMSEKWQPAAVIPTGAPTPSLDREPGSAELVHESAEGSQWRFPGWSVEMHHVESEGYFLNVSAPEPAVFVMWRMYDDGSPPPARPVIVTLSYNEAARMMDGGEQVDSVAMPAPIFAWLSQFVAENYKPEPKKKQRRNDPFAADQGADDAARGKVRRP